jgi:hypothetical protein
MHFNMQMFLDSIEHEKSDVRLVYCELSQRAYRDGVLEGLRLGEVIARDAATAEASKLPQADTVALLTRWRQVARDLNIESQIYPELLIKTDAVIAPSENPKG